MLLVFFNKLCQYFPVIELSGLTAVRPWWTDLMEERLTLPHERLSFLSTILK